MYKTTPARPICVCFSFIFTFNVIYLSVFLFVSFLSVCLCFKKSGMVQHSTLNSSTTMVKKLPTTNNSTPRSIKKSSQMNMPLSRETTALKLPPLAKRTPSSSKKITSSH